MFSKERRKQSKDTLIMKLKCDASSPIAPVLYPTQCAWRSASRPIRVTATWVISSCMHAVSAMSTNVILA